MNPHFLARLPPNSRARRERDPRNLECEPSLKSSAYQLGFAETHLFREGIINFRAAFSIDFCDGLIDLSMVLYNMLYNTMDITHAI